MLDRASMGEIPRKHHVALRGPDGALRHEQCLTRAGFDGPYSILYHVNRPHAVTHSSTRLRPRPLPSANEARGRRHFRTGRLPAVSPGEPVALLTSESIELSIWRPQADDAHYRVQADADVLLFVRSGEGTLRSAFGDLAFSPNDYVCVPKGVLHRFLCRGPIELLQVACRGLSLPAQYRNEVGQLRMDAPYCHRDFRRPVFDGPIDEGLRELVVVHRDRDERLVCAHSPLDAVGWDGTVYPWALPILAFQPRVASVHLPPTWHGTFAAEGALVCSFVPRLLDFAPDAVPCPYPHASVDIDEVLYYVRGQFGSRTGIEEGSLTLHARGVPHGPHPGRYEQSLGQQRTDELAVMLDCRDPLVVCAGADAVEDAGYDASFAG
jgi:homogentisate 1,2-dioxygenase